MKKSPCAVNNHLSTGSEDGKSTGSISTTVKIRPKKTTHNGNNPNDYDTPKRPLPETTTPETYIHNPDFNCDPYHNPKIYNKTTLTFKQRECTPIEEFIKTTEMNISTEPRHRPKTIQPVPEYDQDTERVTEILVDESTTRPKSILKNHGSQTTAPQSPPKHQTANPIRAGIVRSPTMDVAPDCHQTQNLTDRTTTEAVDLTQSPHRKQGE